MTDRTLRRAAAAKYAPAPEDNLATVQYRLIRGLPLTEVQQHLARYFDPEPENSDVAIFIVGMNDFMPDCSN